MSHFRGLVGRRLGQEEDSPSVSLGVMGVISILLQNRRRCNRFGYCINSEYLISRLSYLILEKYLGAPSARNRVTSYCYSCQ